MTNEIRKYTKSLWTDACIAIDSTEYRASAAVVDLTEETAGILLDMLIDPTVRVDDFKRTLNDFGAREFRERSYLLSSAILGYQPSGFQGFDGLRSRVDEFLSVEPIDPESN